MGIFSRPGPMQEDVWRDVGEVWGAEEEDYSWDVVMCECVMMVITKKISVKKYRVSDPMLNRIPNSVHFVDYLNFGALFDIFLWTD